MAETSQFEVRDDLKAWLLNKGFQESKGKPGLYVKSAGEGVAAFVDFRKSAKGKRYAKDESGFIDNKKSPERCPEILLEYKLFRDQVWADMALDGKKEVSHEENVAPKQANTGRLETYDAPEGWKPADKSPTMGQKLQEAMTRAPPAKESAPTRNLPQVSPAHESTPVARKSVSFGIDWQGLPKEAVIDMGGKPYITKAGLSFVGMKAGVRKVEVKHVRWSFDKGPDGTTGVAIAMGVVTMDDGREYVDYGVAHKDNTNAMIVKGGNLDHMASTRASNRALRLATACGYCSVEELPEPPREVIDAEFTDA